MAAGALAPSDTLKVCGVMSTADRHEIADAAEAPA